MLAVFGVDERKSSGDKFPWALFAFLFLVFAISGWSFSPKPNGYDMSNGEEIAALARNGSLGRQITVALLGIYGVATLFRHRFKNVRVNGWSGVAFLLFVAWACISIQWSADFQLTAKAAVRLLAMCFGAVAVATQLSSRKIASVIFRMSLLTLLIGVATELLRGTFQPSNDFWRLSGPMHPVSMAWNCSLLSLSSFYLSKTSHSLRNAYRTALIVGMISLTLTKSRMAFASTALVLLLYIFIELARPLRVAAVAALAGCICLGFLVIGARSERHIVSFGRGIDGQDSVSSLTGRIPLWEDCLSYASSKPWGGYGYNTFVSQSTVLGNSDAQGWMSSPHSAYVGTLLELGTVGLILLVLMFVMSIRLMIFARGARQDRLFALSILLWTTINLSLESFLISSAFLSTFIVWVVLAKICLNPELLSHGSVPTNKREV